MNRLMLRFRPIAPKPVGGEGASGAGVDRGNVTVRRTKRKYVRVRGRQSKQCERRKVKEEKKTSPPSENSGGDVELEAEKGVVTLQFLPERSEGDGGRSCVSSEGKVVEENRITDRRCNLNDATPAVDTAADFDGGAADLKGVGSVSETWVIVESVTDKFTGVGLGFSDKEKIYELERDTCPGFISDWKNSVIWVNAAYKKMAAEEEEAAADKGFLVWLVTKEELPYFYPSFACRVRVVQRRGQGQNWNKILPCDVWRMEFGGFAWKLDVNTALSLSL